MTDVEKLESRLRGMTTSQLRGRYKRIFERLKDPLQMLVRDGLSVLADVNLEKFECAAPTEWAALQARIRRKANADGFKAAETEEDEFEDSEITDSGQNSEARGVAARNSQAGTEELIADLIKRELLHEVETVSQSELLEALSQHPGRLVRAREMTLQQYLVEVELKNREEPIPDPTQQTLSLAPLSSKSEAIDRTPGNSAESDDNLLHKIGERANQASSKLGDKLSEATRQVADSAAKASGKALWASVKTAFNYSQKAGTSSKPVPVRRAPKRKRQQPASQADELISLIERLHELKDKGILSEEEFNKKKTELLERL